MPPAAAPAATLSAGEVRAIVTEAVARSEQRQQAVLARLAEPRPASPAAPQVTRADLEELRNDSDQAWRMLQTRIDQLWKEAGQLNVASFQR
jgi:hypothetical protein